MATHVAKDAFPPRRTPAVNAASARGTLTSPHPPRVVEIAPGVCFSAPEESFGHSYDDNERDGINDSFLFAVRGSSCVSEAAWAAAEEHEDYGFLGQMAVLPSGEAFLEDKMIEKHWNEVLAAGATAHQVWYVHDDGSSDSALLSLAWVSPKIRAGLRELVHPTAGFVSDEETLSLAATGYFERFIKDYEERRLLEPVPVGPRSRPSSLSY